MQAILPTRNSTELTAPEILMLSYATKFHTGNNEFQQFWKYRYQVSPQEILDNLYSFGYIQTSDIETSLKNLRLPLLKDMAQHFSLSKSGKKSDIIERIVTSLSESDINSVFPVRYYELTQKGVDMINKHPNVLFIHRHQIFELNLEIGLQQIDIYTYIEQILKKRMQYFSSHNNWGLYRNCIYQMSKLYDLQEDYMNSLLCLINVAYNDISGLRNGVDPKNLIGMDKYTDFTNINQWIPTGIISSIADKLKLLKMSLSDFEKICHEQIFNNINLPFHFLTKTDTCQIITNEVSVYLELSTYDRHLANRPTL